MKYKLFGHTGLRVSEICLGTMGFGTEWGWGIDKTDSFKILDQYTHAGGNFIDTANRYTEGTSERIIGEYIHGDRDHFVIATKYSLKDRNGDPNFAGNHRKNMMRSVQESLKRLRTEYIDLLWLHIWDGLTPIDEIMRGFEDLITRGMVHYIGISDTPAWVISQANTLADLRGWSRFAGVQIEYSLIQRSIEPEYLPLVHHWGMTLTPWAPLAGGALSGKYLQGESGRLKPESSRLNERSKFIAKVVVDIASKRGVSPSQVALNWTRQGKNVSVIPIVGVTKVHQLQDNLGCLSFELSDEEMAILDKASEMPLPFPYSFFREAGVIDVTYAQTKHLIQDRRCFE